MCAEPIAAAKRLSITRDEGSLDAGFRVRSEDVLLTEPRPVARIDHRPRRDESLDDWRIVGVWVVVDGRPQHVAEHRTAPGVFDFERSSARDQETDRLHRSRERRQMQTGLAIAVLREKVDPL